MLGTVNGIQAFCIVQITDGGNHIQIQLKRGRVLVVVVIAHGRVRFGAIEAGAFCRNGIPVPAGCRAHTAGTSWVAGTATKRVGGWVPTHTIPVIEQRHTIDKNTNIAAIGGGGCAHVFLRVQRHFEYRVLVGSVGGVSILERPGWVGRHARSLHIHEIVGILHLLAVDE